MVKNLLTLPKDLPDEEIFELLATGAGIKIERIISTGQATPEGEWYDQERDEWVVLLQGEAVVQYEDGKRIRMCAGDYVFIPAHEKHRVESTTTNPACIWLAIHAAMTI